MNKEEMEALEKVASKREMTVEEVTKYREYSSRSLNDKEWIEYLRLCEKVFKNTSKYLYLYEHEIREINKYINELQQENKELHNKIDKAIEYMNGEEFFLLMNSIQTPDKAVCEDYFKAKGFLLEILKVSDVDEYGRN